MNNTSLTCENLSPAVLTAASEPPDAAPARDGPDAGGISSDDPATAAMSAPIDPAGRWRLIHEQQRQSGLSIAAFCRRHGIGESSFFTWKRRFAADAQAAGRPAFLPIRAAASPAAGVAGAQEGRPVELRLPGRHRIVLRRGFDPRALRQLLDLLREEPS
jgi:transposase-like protein